MSLENARDCKHGRQRGKCADCDVTELEQRISELEAERDELRAKLKAAEEANETLRQALHRLTLELDGAAAQPETCDCDGFHTGACRSRTP